MMDELSGLVDFLVLFVVCWLLDFKLMVGVSFV